jgi:hypothetical protein
MKFLLLPLISGIFMMPVDNTPNAADQPAKTQNCSLNEAPSELTFQQERGNGKLACVEFKAQEFCRAEVPDFDFDARFTIVSATAYFSAANFPSVEKGFISSNSLKPLKKLMDRCLPGTRVTFDDIKVKGPDDKIRTIQGVSWLLY